MNARIDDGRTPLHFAAGFGRADCVPVLLSAGAKVIAVDNEGNTPLHIASSAVVPLLIAAGADINAKNHDQNVPLHRNYQPEFLSVGVNVRNRYGWTPLHFAAMSGNSTAIQWLLDRGADPEARTTQPGFYRAGHMSAAFGRGDRIEANLRPLDLARDQHDRTKWNTQAHAEAVQRLKSVTKRKNWFRH